MNKEKKICFCITRRRVTGTVLLVASVLNVIIVGAAFDVTFPEAVPTATASQTLAILTRTLNAPTATQGISLPVTTTFTDAPTQTATVTPTETPTSTSTSTPTSTETPIPTATVCTPYYWWPVYFVERSDSLYSIALKTGSTIDELSRANCLVGTIIFVGQKLYVPQLPITTATFTPTLVVPTNALTTFSNLAICYGSSRVAPRPTYDIFINVTPDDLEGIASLSAFYRVNNGSWNRFVMTSYETYYAGSGPLGVVPARDDVVYYMFESLDKVGYVFTTAEDRVPLQACNVIN